MWNLVRFSKYFPLRYYKNVVLDRYKCPMNIEFTSQNTTSDMGFWPKPLGHLVAKLKLPRHFILPNYYHGVCYFMNFNCKYVCNGICTILITYKMKIILLWKSFIYKLECIFYRLASLKVQAQSKIKYWPIQCFLSTTTTYGQPY